MELMLAGFDEDDDGTDGSGSVILAERNKVVLRVLKKVLDEGTRKKIGIFYGGGHMPDLERRLIRELGFRRVRHEWLLAWDIRRAAKKGEAGEAEAGKEGKEPDAVEPPADGEKAPGSEREAPDGDEPRPPAPGGPAERAPDGGERVRDF
jgi:hypothetical protein